MSPLIASTPTGAGLGLIQSVMSSWDGVDQTASSEADPILAAVAANSARATTQPVQSTQKAQVASVSSGNVTADTVTNGNAANPVLAATSSTPVSSTGNDTWNKLNIGQTINGGKVLDANVFQSTFGNYLAGGGIRSIDGGSYSFMAAANNDGAFGAKLGNNLGDEARISLAGFNANKYVIADYQPETESQGYQEGKYDLEKAKADYAKAAADPNAIYRIDSQKVGADSHLDRNLTYYVKRGDRLIPVQSQDYKQDSVLKDVWNGVGPLLAIAASAFLGPEVAAAFGGGIGGGAAAGATLGGIQSGLSGGNILKGAALGALGGGVSAGVSGAFGGGDLGKIIGGAAGAGAKSLAGGGGDPLTAAIMGGVSGASGAIGSSLGLDSNSAGFVNFLMKQGVGEVIKKGRKP